MFKYASTYRCECVKYLFISYFMLLDKIEPNSFHLPAAGRLFPSDKEATSELSYEYPTGSGAGIGVSRPPVIRVYAAPRTCFADASTELALSRSRFSRSPFASP